MSPEPSPEPPDPRSMPVSPPLYPWSSPPLSCEGNIMASWIICSKTAATRMTSVDDLILKFLLLCYLKQYTKYEDCADIRMIRYILAWKIRLGDKFSFLLKQKQKSQFRWRNDTNSIRFLSVEKMWQLSKYNCADEGRQHMILISVMYVQIHYYNEWRP